MLDQKTINQNVPVNIIHGIDNICDILNRFIVSDLKCKDVLLFVSDKPIEINNVDDLNSKKYEQIYLDLFWEKFEQDKNCDILKKYLENEGMPEYLALYLDHLTYSNDQINMQKIVFQNVHLVDHSINKLVECIKEIRKNAYQTQKIAISFELWHETLFNIESLFLIYNGLSAPKQDFKKLKDFLISLELGKVNISIEYNMLDDLSKMAVAKMI